RSFERGLYASGQHQLSQQNRKNPGAKKKNTDIVLEQKNRSRCQSTPYKRRITTSLVIVKKTDQTGERERDQVLIRINIKYLSVTQPSECETDRYESNPSISQPLANQI